jgi:tetratricopeptide (TPR) repeat protein
MGSGGEVLMGRFRGAGGPSWWVVLAVWLVLAAAAAALGAMHAPGVWVAAATGVAAALGSLVTAWVVAAADKPGEGGAGGGAVPGRPAQLPAGTPDFTGRVELSRRLRSLLADRDSPAVVVTAVAGQGGVGKTTLVVRAAHELAPRFPNGQLYVNLRGIEAEAADPVAVLGDFLRDLGVDPAAVPDGVEARARLYRSRLAGRRVLVVLDNARDEAQVRPLLPGDRSCAVVITSRSRLAGLEGAAMIAVDALPAGEAIELLGKIAGAARVAAEPGAARVIVEACGCLPLAVRVAGARLAARPDWPLAEMAARLSRERGRLDELRAGDLDVRASLALGYASLPPQARQAFRMLGVLKSGDFAVWPLAALLDLPAGAASRLAEQLANAHLLQVQGLDAAGQPRYRFHDLVRDFARERLNEEDSPSSRRAAEERFLGACLSLTEVAEPLLEPGGFTHAPASAPRWPASPDPGLTAAVQAGAARWYAAERPGLVLAVVQAHAAGLHDATWELADNLCAYLDVASLWDDWAEVHRLALDAARQAGSGYGQAVIRRNLGMLERMRGHAAEARAHFAFAVDAFEAAGDEPQAADTLGNLSDVDLDERDYPAATRCLDRSLALFQRHHLPRGEGWAWQMLSAVASLDGRPRDALTLADHAEAIFRSTGDTRGLGWALRCLADSHRDLGDDASAASAYGTALSLLSEAGDLRGIALTRVGIAVLSERQHGIPAAVREYEQALAIFRDIGDTRSTGATLLSLGLLHATTGNHAKARDYCQESLATYQAISDQRGITEATIHLNHATSNPQATPANSKQT